MVAGKDCPTLTRPAEAGTLNEQESVRHERSQGAGCYPTGWLADHRGDGHRAHRGPPVPGACTEGRAAIALNGVPASDMPMNMTQPAPARSSALDPLGRSQPRTGLGCLRPMAASGLSPTTAPWLSDVLLKHVNAATIQKGESICDVDLGCSHATRAFLSCLNSRPRFYGNACRSWPRCARPIMLTRIGRWQCGPSSNALIS